MSLKTVEEKKLKWINIEAVDEQSIEFLKQNFSFHPLDLEDIKSKSQTPKIDIYTNYIFLVLHFPEWNEKTQMLQPQEVDVFLGENFLITVQHHSSKIINDFFHKSMSRRSLRRRWMSQNSGYLLSRILNMLFRGSQNTLNILGAEIATMEQSVFSDDQDNTVIFSLAELRRNILQLRRILDPQRQIVSHLSHIRKPFIPEETSLYIDDVHDYLNKLWSIVETYRDTIDGLHVTVESLINQRTNKVVGSLTIISVGLLPLTLLSGIYGMNIEGLPFAHSPVFVWLMFALLTTFILLVILFMKKKKLI